MNKYINTYKDNEADMNGISGKAHLSGVELALKAQCSKYIDVTYKPPKDSESNHQTQNRRRSIKQQIKHAQAYLDKQQGYMGTTDININTDTDHDKRSVPSPDKKGVKDDRQLSSTMPKEAPLSEERGDLLNDSPLAVSTMTFIKHEEEDDSNEISQPLFDAATARLIELTPDQIQLTKYPVGCPVWYDIQPGTKDMKTKVGVVKSISVHVTTRNVLYEVTPSSINSKETTDKLLLHVEEQMCYAPKCPVHIIQADRSVKGEVISCNTWWADKSLRKSYMVTLFLEGNQISVLPAVNEDTIKYDQVAVESANGSID